MDEKQNACEGCGTAACSAKGKREGESDKEFEERQALANTLCRIEHKILVLSGKGGVGKSSVAAGLATALARRGKRVGLLDIDLHGPSIPGLLGIKGLPVGETGGSIQPVRTPEGVVVMSIGLLLRSRDDAVIWRGPLKYNMIKQFLSTVAWGDLDYLIVDSPPGTGDEPLSVGQLITDADGAVIVTTPQAVAIDNVRRSITFARQLNLPVLGVVENMSGYVCPECGTKTDLFGSGGGAAMACDMGVPFLGNIPIDPAMVEAGDEGRLASYLTTDAAGAVAFAGLVERLVGVVEAGESAGAEPVVGVGQGGA